MKIIITYFSIEFVDIEKKNGKSQCGIQNLEISVFLKIMKLKLMGAGGSEGPNAINIEVESWYEWHLCNHEKIRMWSVGQP